MESSSKTEKRNAFLHKNQEGSAASSAVHRIQMRVLFSYATLMFVVTMILSMTIFSGAQRVLTDKVAALVSANSHQIGMNADSYFQKVEKTAALLFADKETYRYNADNDWMDEYEKIKREEEISDRIQDLGLNENFTDFFVLYQNNKRIGWTSNTTADMFPDRDKYEIFSGYIVNKRTLDGWAFGVDGHMDRMYYVKRLNKDAILVASFYTRELAEVFEIPAQLQGMTVRLVDDNDLVLYSSDPEEVGNPLDGALTARIAEGRNHRNDRFIVNVTNCENGWRVVSSIERNVILSEVNTLRTTVLAISAFVCLMALLIGALIVRRWMARMDTTVEDLEKDASTDRLSGLLNKISFQNLVDRKGTNPEMTGIRTMIMIDTDHFKSVNDTMGHAKGDEVITRLGALFGPMKDAGYLVGRIGGDEFAFYREFMYEDRDLVLTILKEDLDRLYREFDIQFREERDAVSLSLSGGIVIMEEGCGFDCFYKKADAALYCSKKNGRARCTLYEEGMES